MHLACGWLTDASESWQTAKAGELPKDLAMICGGEEAVLPGLEFSSRCQRNVVWNMTLSLLSTRYQPRRPGKGPGRRTAFIKFHGSTKVGLKSCLVSCRMALRRAAILKSSPRLGASLKPTAKAYSPYHRKCDSSPVPPNHNVSQSSLVE
jgi:hypothetical protein